MKKILLTGVTGLIGTALARKLIQNDYCVIGTTRRIDYECNEYISDNKRDLEKLKMVVVGEMNGESNWLNVLDGVDVIVHLAARVHVMHEAAKDPLRMFCKVNYDGTVRLADQAARLGVKRFVYISSVKVHGEKTNVRPFSAGDKLAPIDPYSISKAKAETQLALIAKKTGMEVTIVRPPIVYGPGVGGNILRLLRFLEKGMPVPLASSDNYRSMISLENIVDFLMHCLIHPKAAGEAFLVSDGMDMSTQELIRHIALCMKVPARVCPVPLSILRLVGRITGQLDVVNRLNDSLQVDIRKTREMLEWSPPQSPADGILQTVEWYMKTRNV